MSHSAAKQSQELQDEAQAILLLVNDNADQLELLAHILASDAYSIISADSAESAFKLIRSVRPDVIVSDVVMPEINGIEFCRKLKAEAATAGIPVLLVSSLRYDDEAVEEGLEA